MCMRIDGGHLNGNQCFIGLGMSPLAYSRWNSFPTYFIGRFDETKVCVCFSTFLGFFVASSRLQLHFRGCDVESERNADISRCFRLPAWLGPTRGNDDSSIILIPVWMIISYSIFFFYSFTRSWKRLVFLLRAKVHHNPPAGFFNPSFLVHHFRICMKKARIFHTLHLILCLAPSRAG